MICPNELVTLVTAAAVSISEGKTADELGIISAILNQLSDTIATIAVQRAIIDAKCSKKDNQK